jgi:hypothetical protein
MMLDVEADCYWCLTKLLDSIQDHYTDAQPGIQRTVFKVKELVRWGDTVVQLAHAKHSTAQHSIAQLAPWRMRLHMEAKTSGGFVHYALFL